jgi:hypothetical protein
MRADRVLDQLIALRLVLDGLIGTVEEARVEEQRDELLLPLPRRAPADPALEEGELPTATCPHPAERQIDASTLGGPSMVLCLVCGEQRPGVVPQ